MPDSSDGGKPSSEGETPIDWGTWLAEQPVATQELFAGEVAGLKSALNSERENRKTLEKAQKTVEREATAAAQAKLEEQQEFQKLAEQRQTTLDERDATIAGLEKEILTQHTRKAFREEAARQKLTWANDIAAEDAFGTLDLDSIERDTAGKPKGLDALIKDLTKTRPYYFQVAQAPGNISANEGRGTDPQAAPRNIGRFGVDPSKSMAKLGTESPA